MRGLWRLLFHIAAFLLVAQALDGDEDEEFSAQSHLDNDGNPMINDEEEDTTLQDTLDSMEEDTDSASDEGESDPTANNLHSENIKVLHGKIDKNGDGKISLAEILDFSKSTKKSIAIKTADEHIEMMDTNKDGKVSMKEYYTMDDGFELTPEEKAREKQLQDLEKAKFKAADKNGDGFLSKEEIPEAVYPETSDSLLKLMAEHTLLSKDANKDGGLDSMEFWHDETAGEEALNDPEARKDMAKEFAQLDLDKDGKLNLKEIERWESGEFHTTNDFEKFFDAFDGDKDAHLSFKELDENIPHIPGYEAAVTFSEWIDHHEL